MLETLAAALQASTLSQSLRSSLWIYPLINTGHVVGIALLFGAIVPLDLRLLGWFGYAPLDVLARVLIPVAFAGLLLAVATGILLFTTRPVDYIVEPLFAIKLGLVAVAIANAAALRKLPEWSLLRVDATGRAGIPVRWRVAAAGSLLLWSAVVMVGRLIGYR